MRSIKQIAPSNLLIATLVLILTGCESNRLKLNNSEYETLLTEEESKAMPKITDNPGTQLATIPFQVKTDNTKDYLGGIISSVSLAKPERDIPHLIDKDKVVITKNHVTVLIDYPLHTEYRFELDAPKGFTRELLLREISKHYYQVYKEEEETATTKTVPINERKGLSNRNKTDGKYGIWGHDITDLVLTEIVVYKNSEGQMILKLFVNS